MTPMLAQASLPPLRVWHRHMVLRLFAPHQTSWLAFWHVHFAGRVIDVAFRVAPVLDVAAKRLRPERRRHT